MPSAPAMYRFHLTRCILFLSKPDIIKYLKRRNQGLHFTPEVPTNRIHQVSIDLLLGYQFTTFREFPNHIHTVQMTTSLLEDEKLWEDIEAETFPLLPGQFVLAQTLERVSIPNSLMGLIEGRSSYARIGIAVHATAPKIDPGFNGHITLEMTNFGGLPVTLRAGKDNPAQLLLAEISTPLKSSEMYGSTHTDRFQGQKTPRPKKRNS